MTIILRKTAEQRLADLADRARADLAMLAFATKPWVVPKTWNGAPVHDVVILGAGQNGLVAGHELKRRGVTNVRLIDRQPAGLEGVWETFARNHEIRSPKEITGADLGIPSLSIESFYVAKHGAEAWARIKRVPRTDWMHYLRWYRAIADLSIDNEVTVADIDFDAEGVSLATVHGRTVRSRLVVLATGMDGGGAWTVPAFIADALPRERWNHSSDIFNAEALRGRDVGILGAGAAAFDVAVAALEAGARSVAMFMRRPRLPMIDAAREIETAGQLNHGHELSDATKWGLARFMTGLSQSPAEHHFLKALSFPSFTMHLGSPWESVAMDEGRIRVETPKAVFRFDHVFAATGVAVDMGRRPELARIAAAAALWRDRFTPPADDPAPGRLNFPYLDRGYRFQAREPGGAPGIDRIYAFNALAMLSMGGMSAVSISCHKYGVKRLADAITSTLFREQEDHLIPMLAAYNTPGIEVPAHARAMLGLDPPPLDRAG